MIRSLWGYPTVDREGVAGKQRRVVVREFETPHLPTPLEELARRDPDSTRSREEGPRAPLASERRRPAPKRGPQTVEFLSEEDVLTLLEQRSWRLPLLASTSSASAPRTPPDQGVKVTRSPSVRFAPVPPGPAGSRNQYWKFQVEHAVIKLAGWTA